METLYWTFGLTGIAGFIYGICYNWDNKDGSSRIGLISERANVLGIKLGRAGEESQLHVLECELVSGERREV